jgi:hypothetical protein
VKADPDVAVESWHPREAGDSVEHWTRDKEREQLPVSVVMLLQIACINNMNA